VGHVWVLISKAETLAHIHRHCLIDVIVDMLDFSGLGSRGMVVSVVVWNWNHSN
jgi:hypothetical protein